MHDIQSSPTPVIQTVAQMTLQSELPVAAQVKTTEQHTKLTVQQRLDLLLDAGSFVQTDRLAKSLHVQLNVQTDGVVTGFGTIGGRRVAVYAQDFSIKGGSLGQRHAEKITKIMDLAAKVGCPIIGMIDSGGARIEEGVHALAGYGNIFMRNARYSGVVPQISLILGPCAGGAVYSPALTDIVGMVQGVSQMFITGPQVVEQVTGQAMTKDELGGTAVHGQQSGVAHLVAATEQELIAQVHTLLTYVPDNYMHVPEVVPFVPPALQDIAALVPAKDSQPYDMRVLLDALVDQQSLFELQADFAPNIITAFGRFQGVTVGIVANQPLVHAGTIDIDASNKAARFIRFCDSFSIPVVSLVDVPGYLPGVEQEHNGIIRHGAKLLYAYAMATVPKITVILRKAFGGAYIVMGSKQLGADFNFAWPQAAIAVLGAPAAVAVLHRKELLAAPEDQRNQLRAVREATYAATYLNPHIAAEAGYIDALIEPDHTRAAICQALHVTRHKIEQLPKRKHGNMPL